MTVKELIEQLQQLDPDLRVFTRGYEGGYEDADIPPLYSLMRRSTTRFMH
jgi:hypothetical protein